MNSFHFLANLAIDLSMSESSVNSSLLLSADSSAEFVRCLFFDRPSEGGNLAIFSKIRCLTFFPLVGMSIFAEFSETALLGVFLDRDEHVRMVHVDQRLFGGIDRSTRCDDCRGKS